MLRLVEMLGGVLVLGRVATTHVSTNQTQAQMDPGIARLNTFLTYVYSRRFDFDLIKVRALGGHRFQISPFLSSTGKAHYEIRLSDLSHVTKGHMHCQAPHLSLTMFTEVFICVAARLSILRLDHRVHNFGGAKVLGRLGVGWRQ
jgi:hypothetical protein